MFGDKLTALRQKRQKALGVFVKAKDALVATNKEIKTAMKFAGQEIDKRKQEILREERLIANFAQEQTNNTETIKKIEGIFK